MINTKEHSLEDAFGSAGVPNIASSCSMAVDCLHRSQPEAADVAQGDAGKERPSPVLNQLLHTIQQTQQTPYDGTNPQ